MDPFLKRLGHAIVLGLIALLLIVACVMALTGCDPDGATVKPGMSNVDIKRTVTFWATTRGDEWMDITIIIDGEPRGPFERRGEFSNDHKVRPGAPVAIHASLGKGQPRPGPIFTCLISLPGNVPIAGPTDGRGGCEVSGIVPMVDTHALAPLWTVGAP